ncbi:hypothetical protein [Paraburkholderia pallida]|uniref:hypothetical protein n=1 Tax=Paraburkholderia pallida TaxID=2547399 RepID=UPI001E5FA25E|nr:hypothetical protein [Paraburkholderia pallida]
MNTALAIVSVSLATPPKAKPADTAATIKNTMGYITKFSGTRASFAEPQQYLAHVASSPRDAAIVLSKRARVFLAFRTSRLSVPLPAPQAPPRAGEITLHTDNISVPNGETWCG